jgi:hypothetical protein
LRCYTGSPFGREAMDAALSAHLKDRKGVSTTCRSLPPSPTADVQEELLVNTKVKKFPFARARINCLLSNFPPKRYPKVADLEPPAGSGDFMHHYSDKSHSCSCRSASHPVAPVVSGILGLLPV